MPRTNKNNRSQVTESPKTLRATSADHQNQARGTRAQNQNCSINNFTTSTLDERSNTNYVVNQRKVIEETKAPEADPIETPPVPININIMAEPKSSHANKIHETTPVGWPHSRPSSN
jgi:hypothetical protein